MSKDKPTQDELREFVNAHVLTNQTMLVEKLLENMLVDYDDIKNYYYFLCPECGGKMEEDEERGIWVCSDRGYCGHKQKEEPEQEAQEVFEWWLVDSWLLEKLEEQGEVILEAPEENWWGRCTTGQAILLDWVIEKIYKNTR